VDGQNYKKSRDTKDTKALTQEYQWPLAKKETAGYLKIHHKIEPNDPPKKAPTVVQKRRPVN
jgi:hypothetical protein